MAHHPHCPHRPPQNGARTLQVEGEDTNRGTQPLPAASPTLEGQHPPQICSKVSLLGSNRWTRNGAGLQPALVARCNPSLRGTLSFRAVIPLLAMLLRLSTAATDARGLDELDWPKNGLQGCEIDSYAGRPPRHMGG